MKGILTILLLLSFFVGLEAQTVTVSNDISIRNDKYYSIVGKMKNRFLLFRDRSTKFEVQAFNEHLRQIWEKEITLDKKNPQILEVVPGQEDFKVIYKFRRKGRYIVKMHQYDAAANLQDSMTILRYEQRFHSPNTQLLFSEDKNAILIYHYEQQTTIEACAFLLDQKQVVWKRKFTLKELSFYRDYQQLVLANDGSLYCIIEKNNRRPDQEEHHFKVFVSDHYNSGVRQFSIPVTEFLTYDVKFAFDNLNRQLVAAGLFSKKNKGRATGYFYLKVDPQQTEKYLLGYEPFDEGYINNILGKESEKKKGITDLAIVETILRRDGGMLIAAERKREYERRTAATGRYSRDDFSPYIVDYYYDDICLISVHPDGNTHWKTILHKKQYSQDDDASFSSFFLLKTPKNLRFLFNDEIKDNSTVSEYVVNGKGDADRNSVMSTEFQNIRLRFRDAIQVASNELIIPSERRNRLRLVRVQY
ncbi:MAG: hypothetical protein AAF990_05750 [Bacteroidota bacterium]